MFVDYYKVLGIHPSSRPTEIKSAFKEQAMKWHPDKNRGKDTTSRMQLINEAYLILNDPEARRRYDLEFAKFYAFENQHQPSSSSTNKSTGQDSQFENNNYEVSDEILKKWMSNARAQAFEIVKDFGSIAKEGLFTFAKQLIIRFLILAAIGLIVYFIQS